MKCTLYLAYYDYNDGDFDVSNDYYKSDDEYFKAVEQNVMRTRQSVFDGMMSYVGGVSVSDYRGVDGQTYRYGRDGGGDAEKVSYAKCEAVIYNPYNDKGSGNDVDSFVSDCVSNDVQLYVLNLNLDTSDEDFEQELNLWMREHENIQSFSKAKGDTWVFDNEPMRNVRVKFLNNANEEKYAELVNCRIMERQGMCAYVVLCEKVNLIENFEKRR